MLSYGIDNSFKQDFTAADLIADLSLVDWDNLAFMDKLVQNEDLMLGSDDETALQQLSEIIENPVLLDNLLGEDYQTQSSSSSLPPSRHYDVLLNQQHEPVSSNNQHLLQHRPQQFTQQQLYQQQQKQQHQQFLLEKQLLQHQQQQHLAFQQQQQQQQHFPLSKPIHDAPTNPTNLPDLQHILSVSEYQHPHNSNYLPLNQPSTNLPMTQPSSLHYEAYPTLPSTLQTSPHFTSSYNIYPNSAPASIQRPSLPFHPMNYLSSNIQPTSTQSSPQHKTFEDNSPLPPRTMPDVTELWDYFSYCHKQVSLKNSSDHPPLPTRPTKAKSVVESVKSRRYKSHSSLPDIYPLNSEYEPPGKKLRQSSLDDRKSEIANISEFEDVKSVERSTGSSPESAVEKTPSKEDQLCSVCGDNAVCLHYGARTCEGCKGFFKRTVQKKAKYVCLEGSKCLVDKRRRNRCQFCRFQKCLSVGMQREVVRMDTLKGRRGRLPSKGGPSITPNKNISSELVKIHMEKETNYNSLCGGGSNGGNSIKNKNNSATTDPHHNDKDDLKLANPSNVDIVGKFYELVLASVETFEPWAEKIQAFTTLQSHDKKLLFESAFLELFAFHVIRSIEKNDGKLEMGGVVLRRSDFPEVFGDWVEKMYGFVVPLKRLCLDLPSAAHLETLLLFADHYGLREPEKVSDMQAIMCTSLQEHISNTYELSPTCKSPILSHILGKMSYFKDLKKASVTLLTSLDSIHPLSATLKKIVFDS